LGGRGKRAATKKLANVIYQSCRITVGRRRWERRAADHIQILTLIGYTLKGYYSQVNGKVADVATLLDLPYDFAAQCPVCGGKDCARFIGYYYRCVIDEKGTYYKAFPIARYLCNQKESALSIKHRTFSLLPYQLVPYTKYSIPFIMSCLKKVYGEDSSVKELLDYLAGFETGAYVELSTSVFHAFKAFILTCINKMSAMGFYREAEAALQNPSRKQRIKAFLIFTEDFACHKADQPIRGPCALGYDFYLSNGGCFRNGYFLFGTPSQFR
jgi:hypothetical protein